MAVIRDPANRIASLLASAERRLSRQFLQAIAQIRDAQSLTTIASLLQAGRVDEALAFAQSLGQRLAAASTTEFIRAGESTATFLSQATVPAIGVTIDFDQVNVRAVARMQQSRLALIREFSAEQVNATREALQDGITRGLNPRAQARAFRDSIGLTQRQVQAVNNYRSLLQRGSAEALTRQLRDKRFDRTVQRAVRTGRALTPQQIDRMVERYQQGYLRYRSEAIGRTEALRSVHQGHNEAYEQGIEQGVLSRERTIRTWVIARDDRVRDSHSDMSGQEQRIGEPFISGAGNLLLHPGDPDAPAEDTIFCRCSLSVRTEV